MWNHLMPVIWLFSFLIWFTQKIVDWLFIHIHLDSSSSDHWSLLRISDQRLLSDFLPHFSNCLRKGNSTVDVDCWIAPGRSTEEATWKPAPWLGTPSAKWSRRQALTCPRANPLYDLLRGQFSYQLQLFCMARRGDTDCCFFVVHMFNLQKSIIWFNSFEKWMLT